MVKRNKGLEDALRESFALLEQHDLGNCMLVCKRWRDLIKKSRRFCAHIWPSLLKGSLPHTVTFSRVHNSFREYFDVHPPDETVRYVPHLGFDDLEFYIDVWNLNDLVFSDVVPGSMFRQDGIAPPPGVTDPLVRCHLERSSERRMIVAVEPKIAIPELSAVSASLFVWRKDSDKAACLVEKSGRLQPVGTSMAVAFSDLHFSPDRPFVAQIRAWLSLYFAEGGVFAVELGFEDTPLKWRRPYCGPPDFKFSRRLLWEPNLNKVLWVLNSQKILCLLDILHWK